MRRRSSTLNARRYERNGLLAVEPKAFFDLFMVPDTRANEEIGDVCVVDVCGPLDQRDDGWCDSYEAIRGRVEAACASNAKAVVLRFDSPGGDVADVFETSRKLRQLCAAAGKPLIAYVDRACSAAYALAVAATKIYVSETGQAGSIGVLSVRPDYSAMNAARGLRLGFIVSGSHKADGNPDAPLTEAEIKETQRQVDGLAAKFFGLVADMRGISAEAVEALDARTFYGDAAVKAGLVDEVQSFDQMLAIVAGGGMKMATPYEDARASLEKAAEGDDANAAAARRALAALDETEPDGDEDKDKGAEGGEGGEPAAEGGDDAPAEDEDKKKKDDEAAAAASSANAAATGGNVALQALAEAHKLRAEINADKVAAERKQLVASRKDFSKELRTELLKASTPIKVVRDMVKNLPRGTVPKPAAAAAASTPAATRGATQGASDASPEASDSRTELARRMGLTESTFGCRTIGNRLEFGIIDKPKQAAAASGQEGGAK